MADEDIERWITVSGNHIPILKGQSVEEAIWNFVESKKKSDADIAATKDEDDIDIDIELEDEDVKMPYKKKYYYEDMAGYKYLIDEDKLDEYFEKGYQIHELDINDEMNQKMNELINKYAETNNLREMVSQYEMFLKYNTTGYSVSERRLLVKDFRKHALEKCEEKASEFLEKLPKLEDNTIDNSYRRANSNGWVESQSYSYGSTERDWYTSNCQRCIIAYEMRRRGYNVEANKYLGKKDTIYNEDLALTRAFLNYDSMTNTRYYDKQPDDTPYSSRGALIRAMEKDMLKEGEGARFALAWKWKNANYGHTINAEVTNGKVIFYDAQEGKSYTAKDLIDWKSLKATTLKMQRIDNLKLSNRLEDLVKWKH